jgi:hypothetical protein
MYNFSRFSFKTLFIIWSYGLCFQTKLCLMIRTMHTEYAQSHFPHAEHTKTSTATLTEKRCHLFLAVGLQVNLQLLYLGSKEGIDWFCSFDLHWYLQCTTWFVSRPGHRHILALVFRCLLQYLHWFRFSNTNYAKTDSFQIHYIYHSSIFQPFDSTNI